MNLSLKHSLLLANLLAESEHPALPRGLVGCFDASGRPQYLYPEIAGYWLKWAASLANPPIHAVQQLISTLVELRESHGRMPTRIAIGNAVIAPDYLQASYLFDHAMLIDGLWRWQQRQPDAQALALCQTLLADAEIFVQAGQVRAAVGVSSAHWSANPGAFLLKALARLQHFDCAITRACQKMQMRWIDSMSQADTTPLHPQLYAMEGALALGLRDAVAPVFAATTQRYGSELNWPESNTSATLRNDVLAQALRIALQLQLPHQRAAQLLLAQIDQHGRLAFAPGASEYPTWTQLFAEQALTMLKPTHIDARDWI